MIDVILLRIATNSRSLLISRSVLSVEVEVATYF